VPDETLCADAGPAAAIAVARRTPTTTRRHVKTHAPPVEVIAVIGKLLFIGRDSSVWLARL